MVLGKQASVGAAMLVQRRPLRSGDPPRCSPSRRTSHPSRVAETRPNLGVKRRHCWPVDPADAIGLDSGGPKFRGHQNVHLLG